MAEQDDCVPSGLDQLTRTLIQLQSKDHEEILNVIDQLRLDGIGRYVSLPQLIVCGDQSSGKSSVLEAISELGFPVKDNLCTRFATELILRRSPHLGVIATIHPDVDRPVTEQERIKDFRSSTTDLGRFAAIVKEAEMHIGVGQEGHAFSKDVLRVEVSGPVQPNLTLVDLPGLYHAPDESQSAEGVGFVESLVSAYILDKRSVILAVISAKSDIALQKVTAFTRKVDPDGNRTIGIITKPDTLPKNSDMEQSFLQLALNKRVPFRLGWHILRNRDHDERHISLDQRRNKELEFLAGGIWTALPPSQGGIDSLKPRLSTVLRDHILSELPGLISETEQCLQDTIADLQRLGEARQTLADQRRYLIRNSEKFTVLMSAAINGFYIDAFFGDAMDDAGYEKRLRAKVQNRLSDFSDDLESHGMQKRIIDDNNEDDKAMALKKSCVLRSEFVKEVQQRMRRSRGRELPGTFNPLIIGDLFYLQSKPWKSIVTDCVEKLLEDVQKTIVPILRHVLDEKTMTGLMQHVLNPALDDIERSLREKTDELLRPQQTGHPITYNHYFTDGVQRAREDHLRKSTTRKLRDFFADKYPLRESSLQSFQFKMDDLIHALGTETEESMERFAASEAVDCMKAYYKVARKKFVDDFSILALESCLLQPIAVIFSPSVVDKLADDVVEIIASEATGTKNERKQLDGKLTRMQSALKKLHRLDRYNLPDTRKSHVPVTPAEDGSSFSTNMNVEGPGQPGDQLHSGKIQDKPENDVHLYPQGTPRHESLKQTVGAIDWGFEDPVVELKKKKRHSKVSMWEHEGVKQ